MKSARLLSGYFSIVKLFPVLLCARPVESKWLVLYFFSLAKGTTDASILLIMNCVAFCVCFSFLCFCLCARSDNTCKLCTCLSIQIVVETELCGNWWWHIDIGSRRYCMLDKFSVLMSLATDFTMATVERRPLSHAFLFIPLLTVYYLQHHNIVARVCVCVCVNVSAGCSGAECSSYFNLPFFCHAICFLLASLHFIAEANWQMRTQSPRVHVVWCTLHRLLRGKDRGKTSANHSCVLLNIVALAAIFGSPSHCSRAAGFFLCFS